MPRRKRAEEPENHERWLVSYADFITLLFAFFTSMYAISSVNEGKYRVVSESLSLAFNPAASSVEAENVGPYFVKEDASSISDEFRAMFSGDYRKVRAGLKSLEEEKKLALFYDGEKITVRLLEGVLFAPGGDLLIEEGKGVLDEVAATLKPVGGNVTIEGHTDNIPIETERFPTNWDLSSARAINVLKYLVKEDRLPPERLGAAGFGEFRPVASNDTQAGRARNRRIDILIDTSAQPATTP